MRQREGDGDDVAGQPVGDRNGVPDILEGEALDLLHHPVHPVVVLDEGAVPVLVRELEECGQTGGKSVANVCAHLFDQRVVRGCVDVPPEILPGGVADTNGITRVRVC
jgi:hypothetical protein